MVDGAFADCAAIDADGVKDAVRTPCRPSAVVIDTAFASTVLDGVWRGGIGEAVRYAAVCDATLMKSVAKDAEALKSRDPAAMAKLVRDCVSSRVKGGSTDFALWCAGRLEAMSGYKLPHGYAVPISICVDCAYAVEKGYMKEEQQEFVCRVLADCGALDGLAHSRHLLGQTDSILRGLDSWALSAGSGAVTVPSGVGSCTRDENPDRDAYSKVLKELLSASAEG
jgi:3-dehydroquinate synthetase